MTTPPSAPEPEPSVEEALTRARQHARAAAIETLAALRALVDAAACVPSGLDAQSAASLQSALDRARRWLEPAGASDPMAILASVKRALDDEIHRQEQRSSVAGASDPAARTVLRALLTLRELLWEFSARAEKSAPRSAETQHRHERPVSAPTIVASRS